MVENGSDRPNPDCPRALGGDPAKARAAARPKRSRHPERFASFAALNGRDGEGERRSRVEPPMTSFRQIEASRHNALKSTGPKTETGKRQSRRNALRHGFTAETVLEPLENPEEYRAFEHAILSEYLPQTPVEQELVRRLASLFWRLRRATSIETGLLRMQSEILQAFRSSRQKRVETREEGAACRCGGAGPEPGTLAGNDVDEFAPVDRLASPKDPSRDIALSYLRLANLDNELIDRLSRYEGGLWRQTVQTLFALQALNRRYPP